MFIAVLILAAGLAPAVRAEWTQATEKPIHNWSGRTPTMETEAKKALG